MQPDKLRNLYLNFFKKNGHAIVPSASIIPENDPTTLFTGSGMQPMMEYFLGLSHPKGTRVVDSQKCFRSQDIEEVGDNRHITFFEMLGNWSFGDYFKKEQLPWIFEFLTKEVGLDPNKLYVSVYEGDSKIGVNRDEVSPQIWKEIFSKAGIDAKVVENSQKDGMQDGHIFYYGDSNWWSRSGAPKNMPAGEPGGPDSEIFYDFGGDRKLHETSKFKNEVCHINCDCGRFLELGNSVFMQYQKQDDGSFVELPKKNVDFGGGFERILAVVDDEMDIFKTSLFTPIVSYLEKISGQKYDSSQDSKRSFRVIADHMRAAVMLAADGVYPSNKEQGYFARRLVRRSIRYAKMIGINKLFISDLIPVIANIYKNSYPDVTQQLTKIQGILTQEEKKFVRTLEKGLREFEKFQGKKPKDSKNQKIRSFVTPINAFHFYQTYGFPVELFIEESKNSELSLEMSEEDFIFEFEDQKRFHADKSRTASSEKFKGGLQDSSEQTTKYHTATHLLHAALRKILGTHVQQKGSNITGKRLRFDFSHPQAMTQEEKQQVQDQINAWINEELPVNVAQMEKSKALESGAVAFFVEKYPDEVTVYTVGKDQEKDWISKELCGGPHVKNTSKIGKIEIFKEKATSAGVRRVYLR